MATHSLIMLKYSNDPKLPFFNFQSLGLSTLINKCHTNLRIPFYRLSFCIHDYNHRYNLHLYFDIDHWDRDQSESRHCLNIHRRLRMKNLQMNELGFASNFNSPMYITLLFKDIKHFKQVTTVMSSTASPFEL